MSARQVLDCPSCGSDALVRQRVGADVVGFRCARCGECWDAHRVPDGYVAVVEDAPPSLAGREEGP